MIYLYFDGGCMLNNPGGVGTYGYVISDEKATVLKTGYGVVGEGEGMTNNLAEYHALFEGLKAINKYFGGTKKLTIYGDSLLVIKMVTKQLGYNKGFYSPHLDQPVLQKYLFAVQSMITDFDICNVSWIPREKNSYADSLNRKAFNEYKLKKQQNKLPKKLKATNIKIENSFNEDFKQALLSIPVTNLKFKSQYDIDMSPIRVATFRHKRGSYVIEIKQVSKKLVK